MRAGSEGGDRDRLSDAIERDRRDQFGVDGYLIKPFQPADVLAAAARASALRTTIVDTLARPNERHDSSNESEREGQHATA